jgi:hypothetical protein
MGVTCLRFIIPFLALDDSILLCMLLRSGNCSQTQALEDFDHNSSKAEEQLQDSERPASANWRTRSTGTPCLSHLGV